VVTDCPAGRLGIERLNRAIRKKNKTILVDGKN
jgi:hypothetical protein